MFPEFLIKEENFLNFKLTSMEMLLSHFLEI